MRKRRSGPRRCGKHSLLAQGDLPRPSVRQSDGGGSNRSMPSASMWKPRAPSLARSPLLCSLPRRSIRRSRHSYGASHKCRSSRSRRSRHRQCLLPTGLPSRLPTASFPSSFTCRTSACAHWLPKRRQNTSSNCDDAHPSQSRIPASRTCPSLNGDLSACRDSRGVTTRCPHSMTHECSDVIDVTSPSPLCRDVCTKYFS